MSCQSRCYFILFEVFFFSLLGQSSWFWKLNGAGDSSSLVPRRLRRGRGNAWYTLFAHALISKPISKNLWIIGYSGNLPCNSDITSLKFLLRQVAFSLWRQQRSVNNDLAVSYALKQLQMSHVCLKPKQRSSMEAILI